MTNLRIIEISQSKAATATARADFTTDFAAHRFLGNHCDAQAHQRAHIGGERAVGARDHHHVVFTGQPSHHLHDARIFSFGKFFNFFKQLDLGRAAQCGDRIEFVVERAAAGDFAGWRFYPANLAGS